MSVRLKSFSLVVLSAAALFTTDARAATFYEYEASGDFNYITSLSLGDLPPSSPTATGRVIEVIDTTGATLGYTNGRLTSIYGGTGYGIIEIGSTAFLAFTGGVNWTASLGCSGFGTFNCDLYSAIVGTSAGDYFGFSAPAGAVSNVGSNPAIGTSVLPDLNQPGGCAQGPGCGGALMPIQVKADPNNAASATVFTATLTASSFYIGPVRHDIPSNIVIPSLPAVPEPTSWVMMVVGFLSTGFLLRFSRKGGSHGGALAAPFPY